MFTAELIAEELGIKSAMVANFMLMTEQGDKDAIILAFAEKFNMSVDEAQSEIGTRVAMSTQEGNAVDQPVKVREPRVTDPIEVHAEKFTTLPASIQALSGSTLIARVFKKTGRDNVAVVLTYVDGSKRTFRAPKGTDNFTESLAVVKEESAPLLDGIGPVAASQL